MDEVVEEELFQTNFECFANEGAKYIEACFGMYTNLCDEVHILPDSACVIQVFDDSLVDWLTSAIEVNFYTQTLQWLSYDDFY